MVGEEESQSSVCTEGKILEDKDDDDDKEDKEELSSKDDDNQGEDGSSKDGHISSRDEGGDSSSVPDTMADQETTSDSATAQPSPPNLSMRLIHPMINYLISINMIDIIMFFEGT